MRPGIVLHQEETRAHCTSVRFDNGSEDFIPVPNSSQCEPALICEENGAPMANLPILVFSGKCQSSCTVLGCEHRSHYRTSGPHATLMDKPSCDDTYECAILEELDYLCNLNGLQVPPHATSSDKGTSKMQN
ncbi:hypothetical protein SKAU_G00221280 [Synaphobranchus kaupii]|uniref:Uncharacterized protein n=1 Tax=Synaphobranchus kaupii TaxID=118154 RepID=A0A9Q1FBA9_SYNKA|nr:hypothetical protein SKAU_G00221280 [Synaphobranchus kaupii]